MYNKYSTVISTFSEHITIFRIHSIKCQQRKKGKKNCELFLFFLILLREAILESKVAPTNHNSSAFVLHTSKTFSKVELFSIFSQTFLELIFATEIKTMLLQQSAVLFIRSQKNIALSV